MKRKVLLSPLIIIIIIIIFGIGAAGAAIYFGGAGGTEEVNLGKGLVGHWDFNGNAKDSSPYVNHGTLYGAGGTNNLPQLTADRKGQTNKAYSFDGVDDYVDSGTTLGTLLGNGVKIISVGLWFKADVTSGDDGLLDIGSFAGAYGQLYLALLSDEIYGVLAGGTGIHIGFTDKTNWHQLWVVSTGSQLNTYLDGVLRVSTADAVSMNLSGLKTIIGGYYSSTYTMKGLIDDVRIYNRALSQAEITASYESYDPGIVMSDLQKGLVGSWDFNGNAKDSSPYVNHGTVTGATLVNDRKGQALKAYSFNGDDYVSLASSPTSENADYSISLWAKWTALDDALVYNDYFNTVGNTVVGIGLTNDKGGGANTIKYFTALNGSGENPIADSGITPTLGQWYHIETTFSYNATFTLRVQKIYVNGVLKATVSPVTGGGGSQGGGNYWEFGRFTQFFNGSVDDVRIYNRALSQAEITALYESYDPGIVMSDLQKGLVGLWDFDGNAKDSSPYVNHGTVTGATLVNDRKGQALKAYSFDGTNDYVSIGSSSDFALTGDFTLSSWIKLTDVTNYRMIMSQGTSDWEWLIAITTGKPYFQWWQGGVIKHSSATANVAVNDGNWHHLVVTRNGNTLYEYVDAVAQPTFSITGVDNVASITYIGARLGDITAHPFKGSIDDVRIYNRALTPTEVLALYESY